MVCGNIRKSKEEKHGDVSISNLQDELYKRKKKIYVPITWRDRTFKGLIAFQVPEDGKKQINITLAEMKGFLNKIKSNFSESWKELLDRMIHHEVIHHNQYEFLVNKGIRKEEQFKKLYKSLK